MSKIKIGMCDWCFPITGLGGIRFAAEMGADSYQLTPGPLYRNLPLTSPDVQDAHLECGAKYGIDFPSICIDALLINKFDSEDGQFAFDIIKRCIDAASRMKIPMVMTSNSRLGRIRSEADFNNTITILQKSCDYAADRGVIVTNENYLDSKGNIKMIESVGKDNFNIFFDSQNPFCFSGLSTPPMVLDLAPYINKLGQVHVKDGIDDKPGSINLGKGNSGFHETMHNLKAIGFEGTIFVENFYTEARFALQNYDDVFEIVKNDIAILKQAIDND